MVAVVTARTAGHRPWDAAMVVLAPGIILAATINWDMWVVIVLDIRSGRYRPLVVSGDVAALSWLAVNLPMAIVNFEAWKNFVTFTEDRGAGHYSPPSGTSTM